MNEMIGTELDPQVMHACILLAPGRGFNGWLEALSFASSAAGLELVVYHGEPHIVVTDDPRLVYVSSNAAYLSRSPDGWSCVIATDLDGSVASTSNLVAAHGRDAIIDASELLARAAAFPASHRIVGSRLQGRVSVGPGLTVDAPSLPPMEMADLTEQAVRQAFELYAGEVVGIGASVDWGASLYIFDPRRPDRPKQEDIEIIGGPRRLMHGPELSLMPGVWEIKVRFLLDDDASRHHYLLQWGIEGDYVEMEISPGKGGYYEATLQRSWVKVERANFNFWLSDGAIVGRFEFQSSTVCKIDEP